MARFIKFGFCAVAVMVSGKSARGVTGISDVIRTTCPFGPPTLEENGKRIEFGDKVKIKMSAYSEVENKKQTYSPEISEQEVLVGRANVPALNDHLLGMCLNELRRVITWVNPKMQLGPLAYMVELTNIVEKGVLQRDEVGVDEL